MSPYKILLNVALSCRLYWILFTMCLNLTTHCPMRFSFIILKSTTKFSIHLESPKFYKVTLYSLLHFHIHINLFLNIISNNRTLTIRNSFRNTLFCFHHLFPTTRTFPKYLKEEYYELHNYRRYFPRSFPKENKCAAWCDNNGSAAANLADPAENWSHASSRDVIIMRFSLTITSGGAEIFPAPSNIQDIRMIIRLGPSFIIFTGNIRGVRHGMGHRCSHDLTYLLVFNGHLVRSPTI